MKHPLIAIATSLALAFSSHAFAGHHHKGHHRHDHGRVAYAKVVQVKPIYKTVRVAVPEQYCQHRDIRQPIKRRVHNNQGKGDIILGGIIGGIIGHELGRNHNQELATVTGALIGTAIAHDANAKYYRTGEYRVEQQRHCRTEMRYHTESRLTGYRVKYRYKGDIYTTRMREHPGKRIRVDVDVRPQRKRF